MSSISDSIVSSLDILTGSSGSGKVLKSGGKTKGFFLITKNSSLGIAIGYADLVHGFGGISLNQTGRAIEIMLIVMLTYLSISLTISLFMNLYNKSVQFKGNA